MLRESVFPGPTAFAAQRLLWPPFRRRGCDALGLPWPLDVEVRNRVPDNKHSPDAQVVEEPVKAEGFMLGKAVACGG